MRKDGALSRFCGFAATELCDLSTNVNSPPDEQPVQAQKRRWYCGLTKLQRFFMSR
jgi:hypothetical protein